MATTNKFTGSKQALLKIGAVENISLDDNLAASMIANGNYHFRQTDTGLPRGLFCGMGLCGECRVHISGLGTVRACMTSVSEATRRPEPHHSNRVPHVPRNRIEQVPDVCLSPDVLVVGAGPAGLSVAEICARSGLKVVVVDERAKPGGQFYKQPTAAYFTRDKQIIDSQAAAGKALIDRTLAAGAQLICNAVVWAAEPGPICHVVFDSQKLVFKSKFLVLATGAFEKPQPFPGWTLPGVLTTGAIQTLLRSYGVCPGKRILVAGNGPLNFQVAAEILRAGAKVVAVAEAAPIFQLSRKVAMVRAGLASPSLLVRGYRYIRQLKRAGIPILSPMAVSAVHKDGDEMRVHLTATNAKFQGGTKSVYEFMADTVAIGYGFLPSNELSRMLGCRHQSRADGALFTVRSETFETSEPGVYQIGDSARTEGAEAAEAQGLIAGMAIIESMNGCVATRDKKMGNRKLRVSRNFQKHLWKAFEALELATEFATDDTIICRCEDVRLSTISTMIEAGHKPPNIKRATRCGMGACQGRYCGWLLQQYLLKAGFDTSEFETHWAPRAPVRNLPMHVLATDPME